MNTPIYDFLWEYKNNQTTRLHMPGHKGHGPLGIEAYDLTEVNGADSLYEASGIIKESEENATLLFGSGHTYFSTEGSSQCIRAMLYLATMQRKDGEKPVILAARNVHKSFLYAAALLDLEVIWVYPKENESLCRCSILPEEIEEVLRSTEKNVMAVYVTSPNYLGEMADIQGIHKICKKYNLKLLVDNAHGAYLHFLKDRIHPLDLGADFVCDSAHKTLPVLTGGAYLHLSKSLEKEYFESARNALALFGSTSPSYLTLASLDLCNLYLKDHIEEDLNRFLVTVEETKKRLLNQNYSILPSDPLRITIQGDGLLLAQKLREEQIECEYADPDYLVLMLTGNNTKEELEHLTQVLGLNQSVPTEKMLPSLKMAPQKMSVREAIMSGQTLLPVGESLGRICASPTVSCPPAIPIVVSGEEITKNALALLEYYGITEIHVVKNENS